MGSSSTSFKRGRSGNPKGKKRGTRNKATLAAQALLDGEAETLTRKVLELAKGGDLTALRLCLERIIPARKDRPVAFDLPPVKSPEDVAGAMAAVTAAVARGELTPGEGQSLTAILETYRKTIELADVERRLTALERRAGGRL